MHRPLLIAVLWAIALWPGSLEAHFRGASHRDGFHSRSASVVIPERLGAVIFGGPAMMPAVAFDRRYFRIPLAGAPYSLPPADVFQPFVYASPIYTAEPYGPIQAIPSHDSRQANELLYEVKRLTREIERRPWRPFPTATEALAGTWPVYDCARWQSKPKLLTTSEGRRRISRIVSGFG